MRQRPARKVPEHHRNARAGLTPGDADRHRVEITPAPTPRGRGDHPRQRRGIPPESPTVSTPSSNPPLARHRLGCPSPTPSCALGGDWTRQRARPGHPARVVLPAADAPAHRGAAGLQRAQERRQGAGGRTTSDTGRSTSESRRDNEGDLAALRRTRGVIADDGLRSHPCEIMMHDMTGVALSTDRPERPGSCRVAFFFMTGGDFNGMRQPDRRTLAPRGGGGGEALRRHRAPGAGERVLSTG